MSLCQTCRHARNTTTESLHYKGFVGCTIFMEYGKGIDLTQIKGELYEGWISNAGYTEKFRKGDFLTNFQLITKNVSKCPYFAEKIY